MHQFEYFSCLTALWFWNDAEDKVPPSQETRHSSWFSGFGKEAQRTSNTARFSDEA